MRALAVAVVVAGGLAPGPAPARAQDARPRARELTAPEVLPSEVGGRRPARDGGTLGRDLSRLPRAFASAALSPVRLAVWAFDRYRLNERFARAFFNEAGTAGLYPLVFYQSGFGVHGGIRFVHRDLLGRGERLTARVGRGGEQTVSATASASSGQRLGRVVELGAHASYLSATRSRFYGYGNDDARAASASTVDIDPLADPTAVATRYRSEGASAALDLHAHLTSSTIARARGGYRWARFPRDQLPPDVDIVGVYAVSRLPGYVSGLRSLLLDVELLHDTRRPGAAWQSSVMPSSGWRVYAYGRAQTGRDGDPSRFARYGLELERDLEVYGGDRVVVLRARFDAIAGALAHVPFTDLPRLGGPTLLRGYPTDRFRDRYAGVASVDYAYPISPNASGFLAVDLGRVWRARGDLDLTGLRVGFGGGLALFTRHTLIAQLGLFSSIDGGLEATVGFTTDQARRSRP